MKKALSVLLCICMALTMALALMPDVSAATPEPYNGTPVTPTQINQSNYKLLGLTDDNWSAYNGYYAIRNASELYGFNKLCDMKYCNYNAVLLQDIVVNETVSASGATYSWTPISQNYTFSLSYYGTFDGNGHSISGLYYSNASKTYVGFIGAMKGGAVKNLTIKNSYFNGKYRVGGILGGASASGVSITNCRVDSTVTVVAVEDEVGGIIGNSYANISNCVSFASVTGGTRYVGAIVGNRSDTNGSIRNCYYLKGSAKYTDGTVQNGVGENGGTRADVAGECTALASASASHTCVSVTHKQVNATCEYPGLSEYSCCLVCGKVTSGTKTETNPLGHDWQAATCVVLKTCSLCGVTEGELGGHSYAYSASGNVITEGCSNGCGYSETATLELAENAATEYTGSAITPLTVTYSDGWVGSRTLSISYSNNVNAGTASGSVTCGGATASQSFAIAPTDIGTAAVSGIAAMTYNGAAQTQTPTVTWNGVTLAEGTDYAVSGNTAANAGDHTLTVTGKGNFTGSLTAGYTIAPADISAAAVSLEGSLTYNGIDQTQKVGVQWKGLTLAEGTDFTISDNTAADAGSYTLTVTGKGNYTGTKTAQWGIDRLDISEIAAVGVFDPMTYNGEAQTPVAAVTVQTAKGTETVPGNWTSVTTVAGKTTFTASGNFTGKLTDVEDGMLPMDINALDISIPDSAVYNGLEQNPAVADLTRDRDYTMTWGDAPINVGTYTGTVTGIGNYTGNMAIAMTVTHRELKVSVVKGGMKSYDGTADLFVMGYDLDGVVVYDYGDTAYEYDDVKDDVWLDTDALSGSLPAAAPGTYDTVSLTNVRLTGEDADNYIIAETIDNAPLQSEFGYEFSVDCANVIIKAEDQFISESQQLDQTKFTVSGMPDGHLLSGITLEVDEQGDIMPNAGNAKVTFNGEDVTAYFTFETYGGNLTQVCDNHDTSNNGFCPNCDVYEPAVKKTTANEWGGEETVYEIYNAGQLYWFAEQVNEYDNSINGRLMADIVVNQDLTAENLRAWTPIGRSYPAYTGSFDGQGHAVSGLHFNNPEASYVGLFGYTDYGNTIRDIHITNSYFCGNSTVGALMGYAGSYISGCTADSTVAVVGESYVGGLIGSSTYGELTNCWSAASVPDSERFVGGLVGNNCLTVSNCYTTASKIAGYTNENYGGSVTNCYYLAAEDDGIGGKTEAQFASGEVAYLLQAGVPAEEIYDEDWNVVDTVTPQVWGQKIGEESCPVLGGEKVYQVTNCQNETGYSNADEDGHIYVNGVCSVCGAKDQMEVLLPGDVNRDGKVNVVDAMCIRKLILAGEWTAEELAYGDLNGSGALDVGDMMVIKQIILGG